MNNSQRELQLQIHKKIQEVAALVDQITPRSRQIEIAFTQFILALMVNLNTQEEQEESKQ